MASPLLHSALRPDGSQRISTIAPLDGQLRQFCPSVSREHRITLSVAIEINKYAVSFAFPGPVANSTMPLQVIFGMSLHLIIDVVSAFP